MEKNTDVVGEFIFLVGEGRWARYPMEFGPKFVFPFRIPAEIRKTNVQMESSKNSEYRAMPTPGCITDRTTDQPTKDRQKLSPLLC